MTRQSCRGVILSGLIAERSKAIPIGRFGSPEELAAVITFLASEAASFVTGQAIGINGGW